MQRYSLPERIEVGGFEIQGDPANAWPVCPTPCFVRPCVLLPSARKKALELGQLCQGNASFYKEEGSGHFHQIFREVYGTTPAKLRRAMQGQEAVE